MDVDFEVSTPVFNIQTYCIHDGPGIRTTVFVKGCPLRCLWCANPESQLGAPQLMIYSSKCTGCGRCVAACPHKAISLEESDGAVLSRTDHSLCTDCGKCVSSCPAGARELSGRLTSVREAFEKIMGDKMFYDASGGGMTISGGEALAHPKFCANLLSACRQAGIHTAVESCGYASRETVDQVFSHVDLALLDIKCMDPAAHQRLTGRPNEPILANILHIYHDLHVPVVIRVPVIPGYNDSDENISATAAFVAEKMGPDVKINLLPYHRLGVSKSESLGREDALMLEPPSESFMRRLLDIVSSHGVEGKIGG